MQAKLGKPTTMLMMDCQVWSCNTIIIVQIRLGTIAYSRNIALEIERHPEEISKHLSYQGINDLYFYRDSDCLSRTQLLEALSCGDAGVLLACPGPLPFRIDVKRVG